MTKTSQLALLAVIAVALTATVAMTQSRSTGGPIPEVRARAVPATRVFDVEGTTVRLNTSTGALHTLHGNAGPTGTGGHWRQNVPPISEQTSGMLDIQRTRGTGAEGVFLIDVREGTTWQLRWRGNQNGAWSKVVERR